MGRPRTREDEKQLTLRLPRALHERLQRIAEERDCSANYIATKAIVHYLNHELKPLP